MEKEPIENNQLLNDEGWIESLITGNTFTSNSKEELVDDKGYVRERDER
jgi:hypothetical protein|tara:strand:+ start:113 stop:259 length:147 start_codon:yes stop_codon:yes gene_type:complete